MSMWHSLDPALVLQQGEVSVDYMRGGFDRPIRVIDLDEDGGLCLELTHQQAVALAQMLIRAVSHAD